MDRLNACVRGQNLLLMVKKRMPTGAPNVVSARVVWNSNCTDNNDVKVGVSSP
jgi:hypothetical protein